MPKCYPLTKEQVCKLFEESGEYKVLEYRGLGHNTKHLIIHKCGYEWEITYSAFIDKRLHQSCPDCAGLAPITEEKCRRTFEETGYEVLEYRGKGCQTKHLISHKFCGYEWECCYDYFTRTDRNIHPCHNCNKKIKITEEKCRQAFEETGEYKVR